MRIDTKLCLDRGDILIDITCSMRDMLLAEHIKSQVLQYGYTFYEVDGTRNADEMADWMEGYFAPFLIRDFAANQLCPRKTHVHTKRFMAS